MSVVSFPPSPPHCSFSFFFLLPTLPPLICLPQFNPLSPASRVECEMRMPLRVPGAPNSRLIVPATNPCLLFTLLQVSGQL